MELRRQVGRMCNSVILFLLWVGVGDDALDDVGTLAQFAGAFVEMLAAGRTAIEHLARRNVVNRAAKISAGVGMKICERRILLSRLMVGQRIIHNRVLGDFGQRDVLRHVLQDPRGRSGA